MALEIVMGMAAGVLAWSLMEYLFHRFTMHRLHGRGILSREHLEHHAEASWRWSPVFLASWSGLLVLGFGAWFPIGRALVDRSFGLAMTLGWAIGCGSYEYAHARAHVGPPASRYGTWLRHHHFHHHFGHPMKNFGVTSPLWDHVFATFEAPGQVRVPRRLAMAWLVDDRGEIRPEHRNRYLLVGTIDADGRTAALDRARAYAPVASAD